MHNYPGQDSAGLTVGAYISGKGYWVTPNVTDDNNSRDSANYSVGVEALTDRTVWIAWRFVNGLEGGTYPGAIAWNGSQTWTGSESHNGAETHAGGEIHSGAVTFTNASPVVFSHSLTALAGTSTFTGIQCDGSLNVTSGAVFPAGCVIQIGDKTIYVGNSAYKELRGTAGSTSSVTINPWEQDLWVCPTLPGARTWTLNHPPGDAVVETTVIFPAPSVGNSLGLSDGGVFVTLGVGAYKSVVIVYDGTIWRVKASHT